MMLEVRDVHTYYGESHVLQGVSLDVPEGRVVALLGRNGVGKTTLIRSIIGFTPLRRGYPRLLDRAHALLEQWRLAPQAGVPVRELSYGEQRQLEIIMAMASEPRLLLLDEPTAGLAPAETTAVTGIIKRLPRDLAMLVIEHDMDVAFELADRITELYQGRVLTEGDGPAIRKNPQVNEIYLGSAGKR